MKSNKKLFAILTLVAFMMTLAPLAAFGVIDGTYTAAASTVSPSSTSVSVYNNDTANLAKITLTFKNSSGAVLASPAVVDFYVKSDRDAEIGYLEDFVTTAPFANPLNSAKMATPDGQGFMNVPVNNSGKVYLYVGSGISGSFKISVYNGVLDGDSLGRVLVGETNISVSIGDGDISLVADNEDDGVAPWAQETGKTFSTATARAANSGDGIELTATVADGGTALEDVEVTFQAQYNNGSWYNIGTDITDDDGEAKLYFEESKTGSYLYRAKTADSTSGVIKFTFAPLDTKTIELKTADGKKIALKEDNNLDFYIKDKFGNLIKSFDPGVPGNDYQVSVSSAPSGSKFVDYGWTTATSGDIKISDADEGNGVLRVVFRPDKEGKYTVKVRDTSETRVTAAIEVEAIKFEDAVSLKLKVQNNAGKDVDTLTRVYSTDTYGTETNQKAGTLKVTLVNAAGVELGTTNELTFASSDTSKVLFPSTSSGDITIKANAVGTYTLTAHYAKNNLIGTYELKVVGTPAAIVATPVVNGKTATVNLQYVDSAGNNTFVEPYVAEPFKVIVPAGVTSSNMKDINETGKGSFELTATNDGKYTITVITNTKGITKTFEVDLAGTVVKPVVGAQKVTMFIGATGYVSDGSALVTDVAPFIVDGRTFVAIRPVADAFGAEIGWNEATQTVTLTRADVTITVVIGSNTLTIVKDGVTSTITADVAAFIKDGRTVLPFRAVGEAFGATVSYDAATQAVTYEQ